MAGSDGYRLPTRSVFVKTFSVFFLIVLVSVGSIAYIAIRYSGAHIGRLASQFNVDLLAEKRNSIDSKFEAVDQIVIQLIFNNNVIRLIRSGRIINTDYIYMVEVCRLISDIVKSDDLITSIAFFDDVHDFVLTDTKYSKSDYFDADIFSLIGKDEHRAVLGPRTVGGNRVVSFVRRFEAFSSNNDGYVVANLDYDALFRDLAIENQQYPNHFLAIAEEGEVLFPDKLNEGLLSRGTLRQIVELESHYEVLRTAAGDLFACKTSSDVVPWTLAYVQDYPVLIEAAALLQRMIVFSLVLVVLLTVVVIYLFSKHLYKPLSDILLTVKQLLENTQTEETDEYRIIDQAIRELSHSNQELSRKFTRALPYLERYSVYDLVAQAAPAGTSGRQAFEVMGVEMRFPRYAMAICEVENGEFVEEVRLHLEEALEPYRSELLGVVSEQSQTRGLLLLNTRADIGRVFTILRSIKNAMNDHDIELTISVAGCSDSFEQLHRIYTQALRQLEDRFFIGKNEVICCTEPAAEGVAESYENDTGEEIVNAVKARNAAKAESALDRWSKEHVREGMHSMEYVKCQYFQLISHVRDSLVQLGVEEDWYKRTRYQMFERIQSTETIDELQSYISSAIQESVDAVQTLKEKHHGRFVERTIDYIQENYCHDISLDDISGAVYLSPKYLSAIFKQETGRTVFSYVTDLRMQKAAALLEEESIQVKDLAGQVGYNNVQSFIRFFKRTFGLTPAQYRKTRKVYSRSGDE